MIAIEAQAGLRRKVDAHHARELFKVRSGEPVEPRIGLRQAQAEWDRRPCCDIGKALSLKVSVQS